MEGVNSIMIYVRIFVNVTMYPHYNNNKKEQRKIKSLKRQKKLVIGLLKSSARHPG
jgi:hypothetical protein